VTTWPVPERGLRGEKCEDFQAQRVYRRKSWSITLKGVSQNNREFKTGGKRSRKSRGWQGKKKENSRNQNRVWNIETDQQRAALCKAKRNGTIRGTEKMEGLF